MGSEFKDNPTRVTNVIVLSVFTVLALVALILRLWARRIQRNSWDLSDYCIIVGTVWGLALAVFTVISYVYGGLGEDITQVGNPQAIQKFVALQGKSLLVGQITWAVSVFFIRASILALYIRIFRTKSFRITGYIVHFFNAASFVSIVLAACLICRPVAFGWDPQIPGGVCGDQKSLDLYIGVFNLLMDIAVVVLPMPVLWKLQMALSKKLVLSGMFGLGIAICILTLIRIKYSSQNHGSNAQKIYSLVALFTDLEALLGTINACLPVMKPIFRKLHSSKASSWLSSVMSGSIPIFIRPSQMGSAGKRSSLARRGSKYKPPLQHEMPQWNPAQKNGDEVQVGVKISLPLECVDHRPAHLMPTHSPTQNPPLKSPRPPVPPKSRNYSPWKRWDPADEEDAGTAQGIYVETTFDVERGDIGDNDRQGLVENSPKARR